MSRRFVSGCRDRFQVNAFIAAFAALVGLGGGQALASAGCDAVNAGAWNVNVTGDTFLDTGSLVIANFAVGDKISFNVTMNGGSSWILKAGTGGGSDIFHVDGTSTSQTYTVTGHVVGTSVDTTLTERAIASGNPAEFTIITATCTPAASSGNTNTDSQKIRAMQIAASKIVAQNSGAAITGAVDGAISDAFGDGGSPVTVGPNGAHFNFAADPVASDVVRQAHDSFAAALPYAGDPMVTKAPPTRVVERVWSAWADVRGTGFDRNTSNADLNGTQINVTAGLGRKLTSDLLVGVLGGYENFRYTSEALTGTLKGDGATVGTYAAWRIAPTLRWDAALAWSRLWYDAAAGTANGNFTGSRFLGSTGLTGRYRVLDFIAEPSLKVFALREHQDAWTDSLGTVQASRDFWAGRVSAGGKLIRPWQVSADTTVSPYVGAYADWYFSSDNALPAGQPLVGVADGWSGRVTGGVAVAKRGGGTLSLGGEYGGLGADYKIWTANARALWAF
ncbi:autotransporter outer membrane beta-barrel domain-containing protein [Rhodoplanes sp. Z2-YC6860]|uniref:autotransporter outer membrane beta-barrel domain-containing protein n=1 Tax=Rhodoplanes sp. Z2-YC6860 TaxID=674703 RepID=UPI00082D030C|nr:autotransporter outer membrane beta-barrel domain-containing protein [Rhodoplanes sp. Z2-YC6860]